MRKIDRRAALQIAHPALRPSVELCPRFNIPLKVPKVIISGWSSFFQKFHHPRKKKRGVNLSPDICENYYGNWQHYLLTPKK